MKKAAFILALILAFSIFLIAACDNKVPVEQNNNTINPDAEQCPLNMINPLSCKQGAYTYYDERGCSVTKCREDMETSVIGSESTG